jgi:histone H3/H4
MSVELPYAPVDTVIRRRAGDLRVSAGATERLARRIQEHGATVAVAAAERATDDGRKTIMSPDVEAAVEAVSVDLDHEVEPDAEALDLPIAPVDRIARIDLDDRMRVGADARVTLAAHLEGFAETAAAGAATLADHADRRTIIDDDIRTYFELTAE